MLAAQACLDGGCGRILRDGGEGIKKKGETWAAANRHEPVVELFILGICMNEGLCLV